MTKGKGSGSKTERYGSNILEVRLALARQRQRERKAAPDELRTSAEVAELAGVTVGAVLAWTRWNLGLRPTIVTAGKWRLYHRADVERFLAARERRRR